jgi:transcriptional regulator with XRE-family HTH domain
MDVLEADLLKEIDPTELGQRIRAARVSKGWAQTQLAGDDISVGYVSRIESGQRRPNKQTLEDLATRLAVPTEHLLRGVTAREYDEIKLTLDFAELSLETGEHVEAEVQARQAADRAAVAVRAVEGALALEGVGRERRAQRLRPVLQREREQHEREQHRDQRGAIDARVDHQRCHTIGDGGSCSSHPSRR